MYGPHWRQRTVAGAPQFIQTTSSFIHVLSPSTTALKAEGMQSFHLLLSLSWRLV